MKNKLKLLNREINLIMNFQIASDLHIEKRDEDLTTSSMFINPVSPILVLAGDIGSLYKYEQLSKFIKSCCQQFMCVLYVPGNHEFYKLPNVPEVSFAELLQKLFSLEKENSNLHILYRKSILVNNVIFTGCTLWSKALYRFTNEKVKIGEFTMERYNEEHSKDVEFIKMAKNYAQKHNKKLCVITHYAPTYKVSPTSTSLYCSALDYLFDKNITCWIFGHTHKNKNLVLNGMRLVSNQLGRPKEKCNNWFKKNFLINFSV